MHKNTAAFIVFLTIIVALLIGLRIQQRLNPAPITPVVNTSPSPITTTNGFNETIETYASTDCGVQFEYPNVFEVTEASQSAIFISQENQNETVRLICGIEFPKPPLPEDLIEEATVAGQVATIYHDASAKDGTPVDVVVFQHPTRSFEVALFGYGERFERIIQSLRVL